MANKLAKAFCFKDHIPREHTSGVVYKLQCRLRNESYYGECIKYLNIRTDEQIGVSLLTRKKVRPKGSPVGDNLLLCKQSSFFESFSVLTNQWK